MTRNLLFYICFIILSNSTFGQPIISSFSPLFGPIGSTVTISGTNFNNTLSGNIVFFGAVKANVLTATGTSITVIVPIGTTYALISVTTLNNNLSTYSTKPFHVTFPGAGPAFTSASFAAFVNFPVGLHPHAIANVDLDGDGKPDIVTPNYDGGTYSMLRNISSVGNLLYSPHVVSPDPIHAGGVVAADLDGDGDKDIITASFDASKISVFKNNSTIGNIALSTGVEFVTGTNPEGVAAGDIDGDGKIDIVTADLNSHTVSILRNLTTGSAISFAGPVSLPSGFNPIEVIIRDFDGDGKQDIAAAVQSTNNIAVFRNTSSLGIISFAPRIDLPAGVRPWGIDAGDIDGDGKPDIANTNNGGTNACVFKNLSTVGVIAFAPKIDLNLGQFPQKVAIGDVDGDSKADLAITYNPNGVSIITLFKNTSISGSIQFLPKVDFALGFGGTAIAIGDMDGDGFPDIAVTARDGDAVSILRNKVICTAATISSQPNNALVCVGSNTTFSVAVNNALNYQWQVNDGSGWINVLNNAAYSGASTSALNITNVSSAMNNYVYRCVITNSCGQVTSTSAILSVTSFLVATITISTGTTTVCQQTPVSFTAGTVNGGTTPVYQWKKNGSNVGTNANIYTDNSLVTGDIINCILTSNGTCTPTATANSNNIVMTVNLPVTPAVTISGSGNNVCFGTPITFTALPTNGGPTPVFQWKKNNVSVGGNTPNYIDNSLVDGDIVTCTLLTSLSCVTTTSVLGNQLVMAIFPTITPAITVTPSVNNICPGIPVSFTAVWSNGGPTPSFQWKKNGINTGTNSPQFTDNNISNGDVINCVLTSNLITTCLSSNIVSGNNINMRVLTLPGNVNLGADKAGCAGTPLILIPQQGYVSYQWQDGSTNPTFSTTTSGSYNINALDACGNKTTDTVNVIFKECLKGMYMPTVFTPNRDGNNDVCRPILYGTVAQYNFTMYNRYGEVVFHSREPGQGWDGMLKGTQEKSGAFIWVCHYQVVGQQLKLEKGSVILIR